MSEWRETNFGEVIDVINGFAFKSANFLENMTTNSLPVIKIKNVANGNVHLNGVQYHAYSKNLLKYIVKKDDVLVALTGNHPQAETQVVGLTSRYKLNCTALINQRVAKVISRNEETLSTDYIYYFLKDTNTHLYLASRSSGSANQANISKSDIENIPFSLPSEIEQKAIANVLISLDNKIDLLHRQNKTLEAMTETLFRQWFIVEAKEDWKKGTLGDVSVNIRDSIKADDVQLNCKYVGLEHIERKNIALEKYGLGGEISSNKYSFKETDILFGKLRPYFHKVCFTPFTGICSTDILVIRPINKEWFAFCLFLFFQNDVVEFANLSSGGTRMPRTDWGTLKTYPITIPDYETINRFNSLALPSIDRIKSNIKQIQILEKLRDNLLPKLMSGEVRVKYTPTESVENRP